MSSRKFATFVKTVAALRHPKTGCPWDLEQNHKTLRRYMLEECFEAAHAMGQRDDQEMCEELGDVLLQVVLNAQIAKDRKAFAIDDVIAAIDSKMKRRHPHVFLKRQKKVSLDQVYRNWDQIKKREKPDQPLEGSLFQKKDLFSAFPSARAAVKIGKKTARVGFDWKTPQEVFKQVLLEVEELRAEVFARRVVKRKVVEELGDVYFTLAQLARHLDVDPEEIALQANEKFIRRFATMEKIAQKKGRSLDSYTLDGLEKLWTQAKALIKRRGGNS